MYEYTILNDIYVCLSKLKLDTSVLTVSSTKYEDAVFFFESEILFINGWKTGIKSSEIYSIKYRNNYDGSNKAIVIYFLKKRMTYRLFIKISEENLLLEPSLVVMSATTVYGCEEINNEINLIQN